MWNVKLDYTEIVPVLRSFTIRAVIAHAHVRLSRFERGIKIGLCFVLGDQRVVPFHKRPSRLSRSRELRMQLSITHLVISIKRSLVVLQSTECLPDRLTGKTHDVFASPLQLGLCQGDCGVIPRTHATELITVDNLNLRGVWYRIYSAFHENKIRRGPP